MAKKRVFIIHGWDGNPHEGWLSWIRDELEKMDFKVIAPQMPSADVPKIEEWVPFVAELVQQADENTYFIGHSMGCQTIMRYLETIYPQKVGGVALVAGFFHLKNLEDEEAVEIARPWIESPIDLAKVKQVAGNMTVFLSDNDMFVPLSDKEIFETKLGAKVIVQHDKGHFTEDDHANMIPDMIDLFK